MNVIPVVFERHQMNVISVVFERHQMNVIPETRHAH
jgi:hypothetical protein